MARGAAKAAGPVAASPREVQLREMAAVLEREAPSSEPVTLDQLLGEPISLGELWPGAFYLSPRMYQLRLVFGTMSQLEAATAETWEDIEALMEAYCRLAQMLVRVPARRIGEAGEGQPNQFVPPSIEDIQRRFDLDELKGALMRMLRRDGFGDSRGNGAAPRTGGQDTGA